MKPSALQEARAAQTIADRQLTIESWLERQPKEARGETCRDEDVLPLNEACRAVYGCLLNLDKWTIAHLSIKTGYSAPGVSARIREIRRYLEDRSEKGQKEPGPAARGTVIMEPTATPRLYTYRVQLKKYPGGATQ